MKIICIGRNYAKHARELDNPVPEEPVVFLKPETALLTDNQHFGLPPFSKEVDHEVELVLQVGRTGRNIPEEAAEAYFDALTLGIDFTARDLQRKLKHEGLPWELAKGFDGSAVTGPLIPRHAFADIHALDFYLCKNGALVQHGNTGEVIFRFQRLLAFISRFMTLRQGDLVFTGTPEGVGPVVRGDHLEGFLEGRKLLDFQVR
jgi:2-keto-4-pentenoate hydratase/2-oxohepta-3-ene-1,7-dioic acid hydratase (catechol pathway)